MIKKKRVEPALHFDGAVLKVGTCQGLPQSRGGLHGRGTVSTGKPLAAGSSVGRVLTGDCYSTVLFLPVPYGDCRGLELHAGERPRGGEAVD